MQNYVSIFPELIKWLNQVSSLYRGGHRDCFYHVVYTSKVAVKCHPQVKVVGIALEDGSLLHPRQLMLDVPA